MEKGCHLGPDQKIHVFGNLQSVDPFANTKVEDAGVERPDEFYLVFQFGGSSRFGDTEFVSNFSQHRKKNL